MYLSAHIPTDMNIFHEDIFHFILSLAIVDFNIHGTDGLPRASVFLEPHIMCAHNG